MSGLDNATLHALYTIRDPLLAQIFLIITALGEASFTAGVTIFLAIYLFTRKRVAETVGLLVSAGGAGAVIYGLKEIVARARPDVIYNVVEETTSSFPSWHAGLAVALYGYCIYLLWPFVRTHRWARTAIGLLYVLILAIAFSRLYLGVHYVSDVLVGAFIGGVFLALGIFLSQRLSRHSVSSSKAPYGR